jgi:alpha-tubulin suppressor-like RCC1 family protein/ankyrin repeat protein
VIIVEYNATNNVTITIKLQFLCRELSTCKKKTRAGGDNALGQLGMSPQIVQRCSLDVCSNIPSMVQVSCGGGHGIGVSDKGRVYAWGCSMDGRLGVGLFQKVGVEDKLEKTTFAPSPVSPTPTPDQLSQLEQAEEDVNSRNPIVARKAQEYVDLFALQSPMAGIQVHQVSCGLMHSVCSAGPQNTVFSWGSGVGYRLGHGDCLTTAWPRRLDSLFDQSIGAESIQCCNTYTGILTRNGDVYSWGRGAKGQLGLGGSSYDMTAVKPRQVLFERRRRERIGLGANGTSERYMPNARIEFLSLSDSHGACIDVNGKVWTWGAAPCLGRRCRRLPTYTSAVKKEPRGGASVYCVPYHLPQPAWDPIPAIVKKLRQYPVGRALSIATGKGFTIVATARRDMKRQEEFMRVKQEGSLVKLTPANLEIVQCEMKSGGGATPAGDKSNGEAANKKQVEEEDSDLEEEMEQQMFLDQKNEAEEDRLIEQIGMRVLDVRGDIILDADPHAIQAMEGYENNGADDCIRSIEETAGPCEHVVPDVLVDDKYDTLAFDLEKHGFVRGVAEKQEIERLSSVRRNDSKGEQFSHAVRGGEGALLKLLLMGGGKPEQIMLDDNGNQTTALLYSARSNFSESIVTLLAHGADINATDHKGYTPLALSVIHRSFGALDVLLRCRRYRRASGLALVYACRYGRKDIVLQLLALGVRPGPINQPEPVILPPNIKLSLEEQQLRPDLPPVPLDAVDDDNNEQNEMTATRPGIDNTGNGPLHWASHGGYTTIVNHLLAAGADPFMRNTNGKLPMDLAREEGHHTICIRLQSATAGGETAAAAYKKGRLGSSLHTTTMQERVRGIDISSSEEDEENPEEKPEEKPEENLENEKKEKTPEEIAEEEYRQKMQFMLHPLCGECNQTNWATRETLLNPDTMGTADRTRKLCPGFDPSRFDSLVCRYCGHSRGRHFSDPLVIAQKKQDRIRKRQEAIQAEKDARKAKLAEMVAAAV